ncbi:MAG TPA: helix-turn-helix domain-containing protein [Vineibacter sp.]|nr:helix-turn-helix domain-containing protein [Vineibacter sp.]
MELGSLLRARRQALGLSQSEVARRADVGRQWLIAVEQGKTGAELGLVLRTLSALGLTLSIAETELLGQSVPQRAPTPDLDAVLAAALAKPR